MRQHTKAEAPREPTMAQRADAPVCVALCGYAPERFIKARLQGGYGWWR